MWNAAMTRQGLRACLVPWGRGCLLALLVALGASVAAPDLDKTQALALQRYGSRAAETVVAWRRLIEESRALPDADKLDKVNTFFNRRILFESDAVIWQQEDYWATPLEFIGRGAGDCEDFSIAKYVTLLMLGIGNDRLRLIYVRARIGSTTTVAHMVLGFYPQPTDEPLILDNLISSVRPASMRSISHRSSVSTALACGWEGAPPPWPTPRHACRAGAMCLTACARKACRRDPFNPHPFTS